MWVVTIYYGDIVLTVECSTYLEALEERNLWQGYATIEIETVSRY